MLQVKTHQDHVKEIPIEAHAFSANKSKASSSQDRVEITYTIDAKDVLKLSITK